MQPNERRQVIESINDPFVRRAVRGAFHVRRYMPFYVLGMVWLLSLALFPTVNERVSGDNGSSTDLGVSSEADGLGNTESAAGSDSVSNPDTGDTTGGTVDSGGPSVPSGTPFTGRGTTGRVSSGSSGTPGGTAGGAFVAQTGKTKGGVDCKPGVRQLPISMYAMPCRPAWSGDNGGATFRGVTKDKIKIVRRNFPDTANSQAVDRVNEQAGFASSDTTKQVRLTFVPWFNKMYELYGRQVEWIEWESPNGNSTEEAQSRGREGACADATVVEKELQAFAVASAGGSDPFAACAAERKVMVTNAAAYFPNTFYVKYHPYLWHTLMDCERISYQVGEYVGKRLAGRKAKWAGDPAFQQLTRKFGTYVPDNDGYQHCVKISEKVLEEDYKQPKPVRYNYQLDISRFPDQAAQAIVQFKAAGVTTIVNACDYISTIFLTQAANNQDYYPEWYIIGVAAQDTDNSARLFEQNQVNGHLFGMSQLGETTKLLGPKSEAGRVYKLITGKDIPAGTTGNYYDLVHLFNLLQAAGPNLTPQNIAANAGKIPPGGAPEFPGGYWSLADGSDGTKGAGDYTEVDDSREVFWVSDPAQPTAGGRASSSDPFFNGADGKNGTYKETYGGRRFRNREWPAEEPPVYPPRSK